MPSESMHSESIPGPGSCPSAKQSAKRTLQSWLQLMASPQSGALQQLARNTEEEEEVEEGDQWEDQQVRSSTSSLQ